MKTDEKTCDEQRYPGAAIDEADGCKATKKLEDQYTRELNNNPRNDDMNE